MSFNFDIGQGNTPLQFIQSPFEVGDFKQIGLKREDMNPTGSHKDRGIGEQIKNLADLGHHEFVISSSGNAAISAVEYCKRNSFKLHIFLSDKLSNEKQSRLINRLEGYENYEIIYGKKPLSDAVKFAKANNLPILRGSVDHSSVRGFMDLALELIEESPEADAIFVPASSGTLAAGIYEGYLMALSEGKIKKIPQMHIVQTAQINLLVRDFDKQFESSESSIADAIVDRIGHRYQQIHEAIQKSGGSGWAISDAEIEEGRKLLLVNEIVVSNEGAMALAALHKAVKSGWRFVQPICILTGTKTEN